MSTSQGGAFGQRYSAGGTAIESAFSVIGSEAVAALPNGGFVVTGGGYGQRYDANGNPLEDSFQISASTASALGSSVAALSDGSFIITSTLLNGQDGSGWGVFGQVFRGNDMPVAAATKTITTDEDTLLKDVSIGATDKNADTLTYSIKSGSGPKYGSVAFTQASGTFSYTPGVNYNGADSFTIVVSDSKGGTAEQKVTVTVNAVNDAPTNLVLSNAKVSENSPVGTLVGSLLPADADYLDTFTFSLLDNANGRFAIQGSKLVVADGSMLDYEQNRSHQVRVQVTDKGGATFDKLLTVSVQDVTDTPLLKALAFSTTVDLTGGDNAISFTATAFDADDGIENVAIELDRPIFFTGPSGYVFNDTIINISDAWDSYDDGKSTTSVTLPVFNTSGTYTILGVTVTDKAGNTRKYEPAELLALGGPTSFSVSGGRSDGEAPSLTSLFMPSYVELGSGPTNFTVTAGAVDPGSAGLSAVHIKLDKPILQSYGFDDFTMPNEYIVADERLDSFSDGKSSNTIQISSLTQPGTYSILEVVVVDRAGNEKSYTASQIAALGGSTSFTIVKPAPQTTFTPSTDFMLPDGALNITAGGSANIRLTGNAQNNSITGNVGRNAIDGGAGSDKLNGGSGNDSLTGGVGGDTFVFSAKLGTSKTDRKVNFDTLTDFKVREDKIWLDNAVFKKLGKGLEASPGKLKKDYFYSGTKARDKNDYLVYNKKTGVLFYDADGSGKGAAVEFAIVKKGPSLSYKDFFII